MSPLRLFLPTLLPHLSAKRHHPNTCIARSLPYMTTFEAQIAWYLNHISHYCPQTALSLPNYPFQHWTLQSELRAASSYFHHPSPFLNVKFKNPAGKPGPHCIELNRHQMEQAGKDGPCLAALKTQSPNPSFGAGSFSFASRECAPRCVTVQPCSKEALKDHCAGLWQADVIKRHKMLEKP